MQGAMFRGSMRPHPILSDSAAPCPAPQPGSGALGTVRTYAQDEHIYAQGQGATHFYEVHAGAVRIAGLLRGGQRQIVSFAFAGNVFGLELGRSHRLEAEAVTPSTLIVYRRSSLSGETSDARHLADKVATAMAQALDGAQAHVMLLGRRSAVERVCAFLCRMSDRLGVSTFDLPMSRSDLADHLGLTIESVSRTLTSLANEGVIAAPNGRRTISILNAPLLHQRGQ